ncbi:hypothetical protein D3C80_877570 [compost metagenome]
MPRHLPIVVADKGDGATVRRDGRRGVRSTAVGQSLDRPVRHGDAVDLALPRVQVGVRGIVGRRQQGSVVQPGQFAIAGFALRQRSRRSALSRNDKDLGRAGLHKADAVQMNIQPVVDTRGSPPLRAFRRSRRGREPPRRSLHRHQKGDRCTVRRPRGGARTARRPPQRPVGAVRQGQHPKLPRGRVEKPAPVRGEAGRRIGPGARDEGLLLPGGDIHAPDRTSIAIGHDVCGAAHVNDAAAVRRELRISSAFQCKDVEGRKADRRASRRFRGRL